MEQNQYKDNDVPSSSPRFRWTIENVSKLNEESRLSPVFTIGPHKWRLLAFRRGCNVNGYLSVYVVAVDCKISRCAKFVVAIVGRTNRNTFKHGMHKLNDPSNGYIVNGACTIELELCLSSNSQEELAPIAVMESAEERDPVANSASVTNSSVCVDSTLAFICAFCQTFKVSESTGSMLHIANGKEVEEDEVSGPNGIHVHRKCMEWAPKVYYDDKTVMNLESEVARGSKLKCKCCGLKGSALGCFMSSCKNTYHFPCAFGSSGCRWDNEGFLMLCPSHSGMKFPHEKTKKRKKLAKENSSSVHSQEPPALSKLARRPFKATEEPPAYTLPLRPCRAINSNLSRRNREREQPIIHLVKQLKRKRRLAVEQEEENESQVTQEPKRKGQLIIEENEENESCDTNQFLNNPPPNNEEEEDEKEEDEEQVAPKDPNCSGCDKRV
ncbi:hypothetical protein MKX03_004299 [Papaver bracteatum]|nr:hypothetical protein MKX03_004299 [Papaver bracteatum]